MSFAPKSSERPAAAPDPVPTDPSSSVAGLSGSAAPSSRPVLSVVRGEPTPEQLAALTAVIAARASAAPDDEPAAPPSLWGRPQLRRPLPSGPGAWRASGLPR
jgi:hypothetical protein